MLMTLGTLRKRGVPVSLQKNRQDTTQSLERVPDYLDTPDDENFKGTAQVTFEVATEEATADGSPEAVRDS